MEFFSDDDVLAEKIDYSLACENVGQEVMLLVQMLVDAGNYIDAKELINNTLKLLGSSDPKPAVYQDLMGLKLNLEMAQPSQNMMGDDVDMVSSGIGELVSSL